MRPFTPVPEAKGPEATTTRSDSQELLQQGWAPEITQGLALEPNSKRAPDSPFVMRATSLNRYPMLALCTWNITGSTGYQVVLNFTDFNVTVGSQGVNCDDDKVTVYGGE